MSKKDKIAEVLRYHGYKVSDACIDAIAAIEDDPAPKYDSWGNELTSESGWGFDDYDSWGNSGDSWV